MKNLSISIQRTVLPLLLFAFCFSIASAFTSTTDANSEKYFIVTSSKNLKIGEKKEMKLRAMFKAMYGKKSIVERVYVDVIEGETLLIFLGGGNETPSVTFKLQKVEGEKDEESYAIVFENPGINNCKTTTSCSSCKIPCGCGKNGGGGSCIEEKTDNKSMTGEPLQILMW